MFLIFQNTFGAIDMDTEQSLKFKYLTVPIMSVPGTSYTRTYVLYVYLVCATWILSRAGKANVSCVGCTPPPIYARMHTYTCMYVLYVRMTWFLSYTRRTMYVCEVTAPALVSRPKHTFRRGT